MKKKYPCILVFVLFLLAACGNNSVSSVGTTQTLRNQAESLADSTPWTEELEGEILSQNIRNMDGIHPTVRLTLDSMVLRDKNFLPENIYPELDGFSSLDVSSIPVKVKYNLDLFCKALLNGDSALAYIKKDCAFQLSLLYADLKDLNGELNLFDRLENSFPEIKFSSYLAGKPFIENSMVQLPVRFFTSREKFVDLSLYFSPDEKSDWKIDEIKITKTGSGKNLYGK